ncbi:Ribose transport system permease protein RbsC [compost metagenome]
MKKELLKNNTLIIFLLLLVVSSLVSGSFLTANNIANLLRQVAPIGLISLGMFLVILTGGIDLSVGSIVATIGVVFALLSYQVYLPVALAISIMLGLGIGVISGYLVAYRKIAPFIATLAMMTIVRGAGFLFSKGAPISVGVHSSGILMLGTSSFLGIPFSAWILLIIFAAVFIGIRYHVFGRKIIVLMKKLFVYLEFQLRG